MTRLLFILLFLGFAPQVGSLNAQVEFVPLLGVYSPTSAFPIRGRPQDAQFGPTTAKGKISIVYGVAGRWWVSPRWALTAAVLHGQPDLSVAPPSGFGTDTTFASSMTTVGFNVRFNVPISEDGPPLWVEAGPIWMKYGGQAFESYDRTSAFGGSTGFGTTLPLAPRFQVDIGLSALIYQTSLRDAQGSLPGHLQADLLARVGLVIALGRPFE
jgi:hypothetical protein